MIYNTFVLEEKMTFYVWYVGTLLEFVKNVTLQDSVTHNINKTDKYIVKLWEGTIKIKIDAS